MCFSVCARARALVCVCVCLSVCVCLCLRVLSVCLSVYVLKTVSISTNGRGEKANQVLGKFLQLIFDIGLVLEVK